jgi:hypothetical protein
VKILGLKFKVGWLWIAFCTSWLVRLAGRAFGPFIFIRPKHWDNEGLLVHEIQHTKQFWNPRWWFRKQLDREVNAYAVEVLFYPPSKHRAKILIFGNYLSDDYNFGLTQEDFIVLIRNEMERIAG